MKKLMRNFLLSILIALPLFIFLFLYGFGQNKYSIEIYFGEYVEEINIDGEIFYDTLKNAENLEGRKIVDTIYHTIPEFAFTDQNNQIFKSQTLTNKIYVVDFFFTRCGNPSFCPKMSTELKRVQNYFKNDSDVHIVSFTVDPEFDSPEVLKEYAQRYEANSDQWHFLTGDKKDIYEIALHGYKVNAMQGDMSISVTPDFIHTLKFVLIDREGRIRGYYEGNEPTEVDRLMLEIDVLKSEYQ